MTGDRTPEQVILWVLAESREVEAKRWGLAVCEIIDALQAEGYVFTRMWTT